MQQPLLTSALQQRGEASGRDYCVKSPLTGHVQDRDRYQLENQRSRPSGGRRSFDVRAWAQYVNEFGLAPWAIRQTAVKARAPQEHITWLNPEPR